MPLKTLLTSPPPPIHTHWLKPCLTYIANTATIGWFCDGRALGRGSEGFYHSIISAPRQRLVCRLIHSWKPQWDVPMGGLPLMIKETKLYSLSPKFYTGANLKSCRWTSYLISYLVKSQWSDWPDDNKYVLVTFRFNARRNTIYDP